MKAIEKGSNTGQGGWRVEQSIAMELDMALTAVYDYYQVSGLAEDLAEMIRSCPADWLEEGYLYIGSGRRLISMLEMMADLCGVLHETDYRAAALSMRALTLEKALKQLEVGSERFGVPLEGKTLREQFANRMAGLKAALYRSLGFELRPDSSQVWSVREEAGWVADLMRDQALHDAFWLWLDRFYYERYRNWREGKSAEVVTMQNQTTAMLNARGSRQSPPELEWLSVNNPLRTYPELKRAVSEGTLEVVFWAEPFGLFDTWSLFPDRVVVSFCEPGILYENFKKFVEDVSSRTKALADPTRLTILRMIRQFDLMNTEMADLLGISRPTVSVHARILREAGLIRSVEDGRAVRHQIVPEAVRQLFDDLEELLDLPETTKQTEQMTNET